MKRIAKKIFPRGSKGFILLKRIAVLLGLTTALPLHEIQYSDWTDRVEPLSWSPRRTLQYEPLISIIVPVFNPPAMHFLPMVYSVINQTYENWQLILINASTDEKCRNFTRDARTIDKRITIIDMDNAGIAGNTNRGVEKAKGEYIALLDHDDALAPQALYEVALLLQDKQKPQLIYSDEDKLTNNGEYRVDPHFKPDWSPQLLRELNYLNHFTVIEKALLDKVGAYRTGLDGAQDYDLFLRLIDEKPRIAHVPKVLYHWRTAKTSTAENFSQKKNVLDAGVQALRDHLERNNLRGDVKPVSDQPGFYEIRYEVSQNELAVLVLPSQLADEYRKHLYRLLRNLGKSPYKIDVYVQKLEVALKDVPPNITMHYVGEKNRRKFVEKALETIDAEACLVVGCGLVFKGKRWLEGLMGLLSQAKEVAVAAPLIFSGDRETIVDAGLVRTNGGYLPLFQGYPDEQHTPFGNSDWVRNVDAVNERCFMIRTKVLKSSLEQHESDQPTAFTPDFFAALSGRTEQIVVWPFSRLTYAGEMLLPEHVDGHFNSNLAVTKTEFSTFEAIRIARDHRDE